MTVKRVKGGYATVHCHGKKKGRVIHKFSTKKEAMAQHRAIEASKQRSLHGSGVFTPEELQRGYRKLEE